MPFPTAGLQTFVNGRPVELLHRVASPGPNGDNEVWRVRPIFIEGPDYDLILAANIPLRPIHGSAH